MVLLWQSESTITLLLTGPPQTLIPASALEWKDPENNVIHPRDSIANGSLSHQTNSTRYINCARLPQSISSTNTLLSITTHILVPILTLILTPIHPFVHPFVPPIPKFSIPMPPPIITIDISNTGSSSSPRNPPPPSTPRSPPAPPRKRRRRRPKRNSRLLGGPFLIGSRGGEKVWRARIVLCFAVRYGITCCRGLAPLLEVL
ncbi:hypothetical protein COCSADRAFT_237267 [Bipolaris sorokiniana ND90Pr]|uniref:Uncharacterized protein n=1 Tax=Cochliobolus sativus (strain ND90Pr / ATCC 201652) TaxID=665912 RepID=M2SEN4_COCSN|nr:uncharacterized protein COCSADRAFT_237267 [Bipolaris sorokiniana ND90Pr]EMD60920.1 hypothetical protein COCSADRAFT_237267 [Bipolaris sorokiniana ND90Pr]